MGKLCLVDILTIVSPLNNPPSPPSSAVSLFELVVLTISRYSCLPSYTELLGLCGGRLVWM